MDLNKTIHIPYKDNTVTVGFSVNAAFAGKPFSFNTNWKKWTVPGVPRSD